MKLLRIYLLTLIGLSGLIIWLDVLRVLETYIKNENILLIVKLFEFFPLICILIILISIATFGNFIKFEEGKNNNEEKDNNT
jgi:cytochrome b subunit of formate dehydrogenase